MADDKKVLARPVHLNGVVLPAGTELTEAQADRITNPKAFMSEPTLADKVEAAQKEYERLLQQAERKTNAGAKRTAEAATVKPDGAENSAALRTSGKNAPAAKNTTQ